MFGKSNNHVIHSRYKKQKKRFPKWLIIFLFGTGLGASGLWFLETNYGPKRLSSTESEDILNNNQMLSSSLQETQIKLNKLEGTLSSLKTKNQQLEDQYTLIKNKFETTQKSLNLFKKALPKSNQTYALHAVQASYDASGISYNLFIAKNDSNNHAELTLELILHSKSSSGRSIWTDISDKATFQIDNLTEMSNVAQYKNGYHPLTLTIRLKNAKTGAKYSQQTVKLKAK